MITGPSGAAPPLPKGKTNSVHVGHDRFAVVTQFAIQVSYNTGVQISPSQFVQHLIDNYGEFALQNWQSKPQKLSDQSVG